MKKNILDILEKYFDENADLWLEESKKRPITPEDYHNARGKFYAYTDAYWKVKAEREKKK